MSPEDRSDVLNKALTFALQRDKVQALNALFEHNAELSMFDVGKKYCYVEWAREELCRRKGEADVARNGSNKYFQAVDKLEGLLRHGLSNGPSNCPHVRKFADKVKMRFGSKNQREQDKYFERVERDLLKLKREAGQPISHSIRQGIYRLLGDSISKKKDDLRAVISNQKLLKKRNHLQRKELEDELKEKLKQLDRLKDMKQIIILESVYARLLGPAFRYRIGMKHEYMDIFLWNVLQNRIDLALTMWKRVLHPVRSAITASYLLREMCKRESRLDPQTGDKMQENANLFAALAMKVQKAAREEDAVEAESSLDCHLEMWHGKSVLDLAVLSGSGQFVEECCAEAINARFYGDMSPKHMDTWRGTFIIFLCILTLGLPFLLPFPPMDWFKVYWAPPPKSESTRKKTQWRRIPSGYPDRPSENDELKKKKDDDSKLAKLMEKYEHGIKEFSDDQKEDLWAPTFGGLERLHCFWMAPIVVFYLNSLVLFIVTVTFTIAFAEDRLNPRRISAEKWSEMVAPHHWSALESKLFFDSLDDPWGHLVELTMLLFFLFSLLRETFQVCTEISQSSQGKMDWWRGVYNYLTDGIWNFLDLLSVIAFGFGFFLRGRCRSFGSHFDILTDGMNASVVSDAVPHLNSSNIWTAPFGHSDKCLGFEQGVFDEVTGSNPWFFSRFEVGWEFWSFCYALSIFGLWLRVLRIMYMTPVGLVVRIFLAMLRDVMKFVVVYVLFIIACTVLFLGVGDPETMIPQCHSSNDASYPNSDSASYMQCQRMYVFWRTLLQSFGEFFQEDMHNGFSMALLVLVFFLGNVILMNLLIAMMAQTYEDREHQANRDSLVDKYYLLEEHTRRAVSHPPPINIIYFFVESIRFFYHGRLNHETSHKNLDCSEFQRFLIYLSRNFQYGDPPEDSEKDYNHFVPLYERARISVLEEEDVSGDKVLIKNLQKVKEDVSNVYEVLRKLELTRNQKLEQSKH